MKKFFIVSLSFFLIFFNVGQIFADSSPVLHPNDVAGTFWSSTLSNYSACDGTSVSASSDAAGALVKFTFDDSSFDSIPDNAVNIVARFYIKSTGNETASHFRWQISNGNGATNQVALSGTSSTDIVEVNGVAQEQTTEWDITEVPSALTYLKAGQIGVIVAKGGGGYTASFDGKRLSIDCVTLEVSWNEAPVTGDLSNVRENQVDGNILMDLSGDTTVAYTGLKCEINVLRKDTRDGYTQVGLNESIGKVFLDSESDINTASTPPESSNGSWLQGYDWFVASDEGDTTWLAQNFPIEYRPGWVTQIFMTYYCYDENGIVKEGITDFIDLPEGTQEGTFTEPEPTDPLAWVVWKLKATFWEIFGINGIWSSQDFNNVKSELSERAPFAYALAVFDFNTSSVSTVSTPTLTISTGTTPIEWEAPTYITDLIESLQTPFKVILYLLFVIYIFRLPSRVINK